MGVDERRPGPGAPTIGRAFLVGCPRSGTTLLQSLITAHPRVVSFPETFFFARIAPRRRGLRARVRLPPATARAALADLDALGLSPVPRPHRRPPVTVADHARIFLARMDQSARDADATLWLEKTPRHARYIDLIERHVPGAHFVHIIRSGEAVVASLEAASRLDPVVWPPASAAQRVAMWRRYIGYSAACLGRHGHVFISYERLVEAPEVVVPRLCAALELPTSEDTLTIMLRDYAVSAADVIGRLRRSELGVRTSTEREPWKDDVTGSITNRNDSKFRQLFSESEQAQIRETVAQEDAALDRFCFL